MKIRYCPFFSCKNIFVWDRNGCRRYCKEHSKLGRKGRYRLRFEIDLNFQKQERCRRKLQYRDLTPDIRKQCKAGIKRTKAKLKWQVLTHYSPGKKLRCSWRGCEIRDIDMLSLDHINNNGGHDNSPTGIANYQRLRKSGLPAGFQTLCANHNQKKEILRSRGMQ